MLLSESEKDQMNIVCLSGSKFGMTTRIALDQVLSLIAGKYPQHRTTLLDLADYDVEFSDGRHYLDYEGDTGYVAKTIMEADAIIIGTPIFQASIPGTLKNVFDLLPFNAFQNRVVGIIALAGSARHYLVVEHHLKSILSYMKAYLVRQYVFIEDVDFDDQKTIINPDIHARIERLVHETVLTMEVYNRMKSGRIL